MWIYTLKVFQQIDEGINKSFYLVNYENLGMIQFQDWRVTFSNNFKYNHKYGKLFLF